MDYDQIFSSDLKLFSDEQNTAKTIVLGHFAEAMATPQEPQPMAQRKIRDTRSDPEGKEQDIGPILIDLIQYVNSVRWTILNSSNWQLGTSPGPAEDALPIKSRIPHLKTLEDYKAVLRELKETAR